jgi:hypothetical protein
MQKAAAYAQENTLGIWGVIDDILIPMELRYLTRRELPEKFCADLHPESRRRKVQLTFYFNF